MISLRRSDQQLQEPTASLRCLLRYLVIGYGNPSRRDDGVGLAVVNGLRVRLGRPPLDIGDDGYSGLGGDVDTLFLQQLMPELAETLAQYDAVRFIDAHLGVYPELVRRSPVTAKLNPASVSHHVKPDTLLVLAQILYHHAPQAELISVRGFDFDFGDGLSEATSEGAGQVIETLLQEIQRGPFGGNSGN